MRLAYFSIGCFCLSVPILIIGYATLSTGLFVVATLSAMICDSQMGNA